MGRGRAHTERRHGFTLVEVLAALAIAAVIIAATGALVHNVALHFDHGTRGVSEGERLILAVERLAADIGSARFVTRMSEGSAALAFIGEPATAAQPARMIFVSAGGVAANASGEEVVSLTAEQDEDVARLVRRRAPWLGPRTRFEDITLQDPVVLLEGKFLISFAFGRISQDNALAWSDDWRGQVSAALRAIETARPPHRRRSAHRGRICNTRRCFRWLFAGRLSGLFFIRRREVPQGSR